MASEWKEYTLNYAVEMIIDNRGRNPESYTENGIPVIDNYLIKSDGEPKLSDVKRFISQETYDSFIRKYIKKDDVLMTLVGNGYGEVAITPNEQCIIIQNTIGLRCNENFDNNYLYYMLKSNRIALMNLNRGAAQPSIKVGDIKNLKFEFPPLEIQKGISHTLRSLDNKIELNRQTNQTLEQMAQALFKSWFVNFDPVIDNALVAGNSIPDELQDHAQRRQQQLAKPDHKPLPDNIRQLFPSEFELTEELGWVPKGWGRQKINDLVGVTDYVANGSFASLKENVQLYDEPEYSLYIRTTDYKNGFSTEKAKYVDKSSYDFLKKTCLDGSEVIISNVGDVGTVFTPPVWLGKPMTLGSNAIAIRAGNLKYYIFQYFKGDFGQHQIDGIVSGSAQQKFNKTGFRSLNILIPEASILDRFNEYTDLLKKRENLTHIETRNIEVIRNTLLPKLISGELRLPSEAKDEYEQQIAEAIG